MRFVVFQTWRDRKEIEGPDPNLETCAVVSSAPTDLGRISDATATYQGGCAFRDQCSKSFNELERQSDDRGWTLSDEGKTLTANFARSKISGNIKDFRHQDTGVAYDGALSISIRLSAPKAFPVVLARLAVIRHWM